MSHAEGPISNRPGPKVRTDVVDVYIFRRIEGYTEFLQMRRVGDPLHGTWQPIMGHIHAGETATDTAIRELAEEAGINIGDAITLQSPKEGEIDASIKGLWALEQVHPFYLAKSNEIMMSPRFACEVGPGWSPRLNEEHDAVRWIETGDVPWAFMWPGQMHAIDEILRCIVPEESITREHLRVR
jgi:8-oxo-dGTP pyrophosphatase MutT (NUDIX family)